jgi:hypothetical protein
VLFLFVLSGLIQPILRFLTYAGIHYVGAAAGTTLRGAHPLFSVPGNSVFRRIVESADRARHDFDCGGRCADIVARG